MLKNALIIFAVTFTILAIFVPSFSRIQEKKAKNQEYEQLIDELKLKNAQLAEERRRLEEDPEYFEKVAQEKMGLGREGEVVYRMLTEMPVEDDVKE